MLITIIYRQKFHNILHYLFLYDVNQMTMSCLFQKKKKNKKPIFFFIYRTARFLQHHFWTHNCSYYFAYLSKKKIVLDFNKIKSSSSIYHIGIMILIRHFINLSKFQCSIHKFVLGGLKALPLVCRPLYDESSDLKLYFKGFD